jgi:hypothetical protein
MFRFTLALLLLCCGPVAAQTNTQQLSQCLADTTSGKDRKDLARWVFFSMASHPEIKQFTTPSAAGAEAETNKTIADLFTRLLAESCMRQAQAAFKEGGAKAIEIAFQTPGQLAMQELMTNPDVNARMASFEKSLDQNKLRKVFAAN